MEPVLPLKRIRSVISNICEVTEDFDSFKKGDIVYSTIEYTDNKSKICLLTDKELKEHLKEYNQHFIFHNESF